MTEFVFLGDPLMTSHAGGEVITYTNESIQHCNYCYIFVVHIPETA